MASLVGQQDPRQAGILYMAGHPEQCYDAGQGDAAAVQQHKHLQSQVSQRFINFDPFLCNFINVAMDDLIE